MLSTLDTPIDWERQGFALAEDWDGESYTGLLLPTDRASKPATLDALLLVEPTRAAKQRERDLAQAQDAESEAPGDPTTTTPSPPTDGNGSATAGGSVPTRPVPKKDEGKWKKCAHRTIPACEVVDDARCDRSVVGGLERGRYGSH
ncbi:hypothetical protein Pd630_LPD10096 (plasmid) [Rhodococcus opacus PD630]|nr:hypothetical protein Pd630_LPD10096 [Rhodococcus opacus PD630]